VLTAVVLFDWFTALDAVGPYEVLSSLPGAEAVIAAHMPGPVVTEEGTLRLTADAALADVLRADVVVVPGGPGSLLLASAGLPTRLDLPPRRPRPSPAPSAPAATRS
jgi:putative intracellular protease/amidase